MITHEQLVETFGEDEDLVSPPASPFLQFAPNATADEFDLDDDEPVIVLAAPAQAAASDLDRWESASHTGDGADTGAQQRGLAAHS